jgi:hypothetical protein
VAARHYASWAIGLSVCALWLVSVLAVSAQRRDVYVESRDHSAIAYSSAPTTDAVAALNARLAAGDVALTFDETSGYLRALLRALEVPVESQMLVFSQTSFQAPLININNPRAVFFNDAVAVGYVRGGRILEVSAQDPRQGVIFYELLQDRAAAPRLTRNDQCLACHLSWETLGVPGLTVQSVYPLPDELSYANGFTTIHGSPLEQRWGGWWVTGDHGGASHMGNIPVMPADKGRAALANPTAPLASLDGLVDLSGYPSAQSDVVALMVLAHQTHMVNLITRTGWEARLAAASPGREAGARVVEAARDLVDYLLFVDEAPLVGRMTGGSGFAEVFTSHGPRDSQGRSLRDLDLELRLFRYACSYMIYTPAFDALPSAAKDAVYGRLWEVLSGREAGARYQTLSLENRRAIVSILRETKRGLPDYFQPI